jgi:hypothetical protein
MKRGGCSESRTKLSPACLPKPSVDDETVTHPHTRTDTARRGCARAESGCDMCTFLPSAQQCSFPVPTRPKLRGPKPLRALPPSHTTTLYTHTGLRASPPLAPPPPSSPPQRCRPPRCQPPRRCCGEARIRATRKRLKDVHRTMVGSAVSPQCPIKKTWANSWRRWPPRELPATFSSTTMSKFCKS